MLVLSNIEVMYSNVILVLKGVSLQVQSGQIVVLLGANGAGKTTTLKAVSGLLYTETGQVTDGDITFEGQSIKAVSPHRIVRQGLIQVQEGRRIFEHFTVEEDLKVGAFVAGQEPTSKMNWKRFTIISLGSGVSGEGYAVCFPVVNSRC
jgi:branched-chain amino acid transport system ATP-binding protein